MNNKIKRMNAEYKMMENMYFGIMGESIKVAEIEPSQKGELGYTSSKNSIHIAYEHEIMNGLNKSEKSFLRLGIFGHELLHKKLTNFNLLEQKMRNTPMKHKKLFLSVFNIVCDSAIEYFSPQVFGGKLLKSLKFMIHHIWKESKSIEDHNIPYIQLMNSLIQFGDIGIVKGDFTFDEAKDTFVKVAPIFSQAVEEPDTIKRMDYCIEIFEIIKPLYDKEMEKHEDEIQSFFKELETKGKIGKGDGKPTFTPSPINDEGLESKRRKATSEKLTKENSKKNTIEDLNLDDLEDPGKDCSEDGSKETNEFDDLDLEELDIPISSEELNEDSKKDECNEDYDSSEIDDEEYELTYEDIKDLEDSLDEITKEIDSKEKEIKKSEETPPDYEIAGSIGHYSKCSNINVNLGNDLTAYEDLYEKIVSKIGSGIYILTKKLKRIFSQDNEEYMPHTSGKLNVKRYYSGRITPRIFDKKMDSGELENLVVEILADESYSMFGSKSEAVRETCIALAEVFGSLKIPLYIIGFTADENGISRAEHRHYIKWNNSPGERLKLLSIAPRENNFDGYSIRYGGEILKRKNAVHKLMIVVSDGEPVCYSYSGSDGIKDTRDAINEVRKCASVLGVAVGNDSTEILHTMYGNDFIHISNTDDLFSGIAIKLQKMIKEWR